jgi:hypothetical protein
VISYIFWCLLLITINLLHDLPMTDTHSRLRVMQNYSTFNLFREEVKFNVITVYIMKGYWRVVGMAPRILARSTIYGLVHLKPAAFSPEKIHYCKRVRRGWVGPREGLDALRKR